MKSNLMLIKLPVLVLFAVFMTACQTTGEVLPNDQAMDDGQSLPDAGSGVDGIGNDSEATGLDGDNDTSLIPIADDAMSAQEMLDEVGSPLGNRIIYFDFDSAKISDESLALLEAHGNFIASNGNVSVRLEGHTDERGSREYNIALGDRRAQSVRRVLLFQGASVDQLETISYGEEQPAMSGHEEAAWGKNRRVEIVYNVK